MPACRGASSGQHAQDYSADGIPGLSDQAAGGAGRLLVSRERAMIRHATPVDRAVLIARYRRARARTRALFELLSDDVYYRSPIAARHPIVFYEGHLPAFSFNTLVKTRPRRPEYRCRARSALRARHRSGGGRAGRRRTATSALAARVESCAVRRRGGSTRARRAGARPTSIVPGHPLLDRAEAAYAILEHEAMHQETLLYMWHRLPFEAKRARRITSRDVERPAARDRSASDPRGRRDAGRGPRRHRRSAGTTSRPATRRHVPAFAIERYDVTNDAYLEFVAAGGYDDPRWWTAEDWRLAQARAARASAVLGTRR